MTKEVNELYAWIDEQIALIREFDPTGADYYEALLQDVITAEQTRSGELNAYCIVLKSHLKEGRTLASKWIF